MAEGAKVTELVAAADKRLSESGMGRNASNIAEVVGHKPMLLIEAVWPEVLDDDAAAGKAFDLAKAAYDAGLDDAAHVRAMAEAALGLFGNGQRA